MTLLLPSSLPSCFRQRRAQLEKRHPEGAFLFPSHSPSLRNGDVFHPYRADSFLYYFSGWEEPHSLLVLAPQKNKSGHSFILFVPPRDPHKILWDGEMQGLEGAQDVFQADLVFPISEWKKHLPALLKQSVSWFYHWGQMKELDHFLPQLAQQQAQKSQAITFHDSWIAAGELRLFKQPEEIEWMKKSCEISAKAHKALMKTVKPGLNEREIAALFSYEVQRQGCSRLAYESIVAGGVHATTLHYQKNNAPLQAGELVLIDAGGEYNYYAADITRTFPIETHWTPTQAELYDVVLSAQKKGLQAAMLHHALDTIHETVRLELIEGLLRLGFWDKTETPEALLNKKADREYYPHGTSHWLGMDVHDAGAYQQHQKSRPLHTGMVFTLEPGLYIPPSSSKAPLKYHGLGIRIEDDLLVTETGIDNLTVAAPKERDEIDALRHDSGCM